MCECQSPSTCSASESPCPACGDWGSPGWSESAWSLRWSVTHWVSGPCIAMLPRIAHRARSDALVSKPLCVKSRWKPHSAVPEQPDGGDESERLQDDGHDPGEL